MTSQQKANELLRGWLAAQQGSPLDAAQAKAWREGWYLRQQTRVRWQKR